LTILLELTEIAIVAVYCGMTIVLIGNALYLWRIRRGSSQARLPSLSVLIPARNESANLTELIPLLLNQDYSDFEIIVYDDESDDGTADYLAGIKDPRFRFIRGHDLPDGWLGKPNALYQASRLASNEVYLFLDADARPLKSTTLAELVATLFGLPDRSALTVLPRLSVGGGNLLVSLAPNSLLLSIPWPALRRLRFSSLGMLNGQCWLMFATDYHRLEPHQEVKSAILEDVQIGRYLMRTGYTPWLYPAKSLLSVAMYPDVRESWLGFRKNAFLIMGGSPASFVAISTAILVVFVAAPILMPLLLVWQILLKAVTDRMSGYGAGTSVFAVVSYIMGWVLGWDSFLHHLAGRVEWKGRRIS
jgi:hypothetical protein